MGDVVSLNRARKARARSAREIEAAANRAKFGRTKAARTNDEVDAARRAALLDGARLEESDT